MIEVEVQNETYQTQQVMRFSVLPRIGEGIQLSDSNGFSASFDIVDVWYQKAAYGEVWVPYIHVRQTPQDSSETTSPGELAVSPQSQPGKNRAAAWARSDAEAQF